MKRRKYLPEMFPVSVGDEVSCPTMCNLVRNNL